MTQKGKPKFINLESILKNNYDTDRNKLYISDYKFKKGDLLKEFYFGKPALGSGKIDYVSGDYVSVADPVLLRGILETILTSGRNEIKPAKRSNIIPQPHQHQIPEPEPSPEIMAKADGIVKAVLPIVHYIHQTSPDFILSCNEEARLIGFTVAALYHGLYGRLPTIDGSLRFGRLRTKTPEEVEQNVKSAVDEILSRRQLAKCLLLNYSASDIDQQFLRGAFERVSDGRVETRFSALVGTGADISSFSEPSELKDLDWLTAPEILGVTYDGNASTAAVSRESSLYRRAVVKSLKEWVKIRTN